jgi:serine/threonine protein kinase
MSCAALPRTGSNGDSGSGSGSDSGSDSKSKTNFIGFLNLYILIRFIGSGAFGIVNLVKNRETEKEYAMKTVKKIGTPEDVNIQNEIKYGMELESQNLCKVHGKYEDDSNFYILMEYLDGMDLFDFIQKYPGFFVNNPKIFWFVIGEILQGLVYLHSQGIAHMDIKPENIFLLLDNEGNIIGVRLIDLGLSIKVDEKTKGFWGTSTYMAPEFFHFCWSTGFPADIWSLGITAFAMLRASLPISSWKKDPQCAQSEIYAKIESLLTMKSFAPFGKRSENAEIFEIEAFIMLSLIVDPQKRPTAYDLLKMIPVTSCQLSP